MSAMLKTQDKIILTEPSKWWFPSLQALALILLDEW
jgi:hypothetical protein